MSGRSASPGPCDAATSAASSAQLHRPVATEPDYRSRVTALLSMALIASAPVGSPIIGAVCDPAGPRYALGLGSRRCHAFGLGDPPRRPSLPACARVFRSQGLTGGPSRRASIDVSAAAAAETCWPTAGHNMTRCGPLPACGAAGQAGCRCVSAVRFAGSCVNAAPPGRLQCQRCCWEAPREGDAVGPQAHRPGRRPHQRGRAQAGRAAAEMEPLAGPARRTSRSPCRKPSCCRPPRRLGRSTSRCRWMTRIRTPMPARWTT
jgi:hypothetical protein